KATSGWTSQMPTRRCGSRNGRGFKRTARTALKIAAFAPIPSASVKTTAAAKAGALTRLRAAERTSRRISLKRSPGRVRIRWVRSFASERSDGIDARRAGRRKPARRQRDGREEHGEDGECRRIARRHAEQQGGESPGRRGGPEKAEEDSGRDQDRA